MKKETITVKAIIWFESTPESGYKTAEGKYVMEFELPKTILKLIKESNNGGFGLSFEYNDGIKQQISIVRHRNERKLEHKKQKKVALFDKIIELQKEVQSIINTDFEVKEKWEDIEAEKAKLNIENILAE